MAQVDYDLQVTEGLDVLSAYSRIRDEKLRETLRDLIMQISQLDEARRTTLPGK